MYAAQETPKNDAARAEKAPFRTETRLDAAQGFWSTQHDHTPA